MSWLLLMAAARACPPGDLLDSVDVVAEDVRHPERLHDGVAPREGDNWKSEWTTTLADTGSWVRWDLGETVTLRALQLQADDNDSYALQVSRDGARWVDAWVVPSFGKGGLRTWATDDLRVEARYLRVRPVSGDGRYSLGEVRAWCQVPREWPPQLSRVRPIFPSRGGAEGRVLHQRKLWTGVVGLVVVLGTWLGERRRGLARLVSPLGALLLLGWMLAFAQNTDWPAFRWAGAGVLGASAVWLLALGWRALGRHEIWPLARRGALVLAVLSGAWAWTGFGHLHGSRAVHHWDSFHYFVGARYFDELGYSRLYECATVALSDMGRLGDPQRHVRVLSTNEMTTAAEIAAHPEACHAAFTPARWASFSQDVRQWQTHMTEPYRSRLFRDHGYNATPLWTALGGAVAELAGDAPDTRAFDARLRRLASVDLVLYLGVFGLIGWAFGLRALALALVVFGAGHAWEYKWTGGAFMRIPWLFATTASLALLKKGRPMASGFALGTAALLRLFPAVLGVGVVFHAGWRVLRGDRPPWRWLAGGLLALALLVPASLPAVGGVAGYRAFFANTLKHNATPLTNHMGLPTVLASRLDQRVRLTRDQRLPDNYERWKQARRDTLAARRPLWIGLVLGLTALLALAVRRARPWEAMVLSTLLVVGLFQLTCYYYVFFMLIAPLAAQRWRWAAVLGAAAVGTEWVQLQLTWGDEAYVAETLVVLAGLAALAVGVMAREDEGLIPRSSPR